MRGVTAKAAAIRLLPTIARILNVIDDSPGGLGGCEL
jgi:hypothetical protein